MPSFNKITFGIIAFGDKQYKIVPNEACEFEKIDAEYKRQSKILELKNKINNYIDWTSRSTPNDYTDDLEKSFDELMELIK